MSWLVTSHIGWLIASGYLGARGDQEVVVSVALTVLMDGSQLLGVRGNMCPLIYCRDRCATRCATAPHLASWLEATMHLLQTTPCITSTPPPQYGVHIPPPSPPPAGAAPVVNCSNRRTHTATPLLLAGRSGAASYWLHSTTSASYWPQACVAWA